MHNKAGLVAVLAGIALCGAADAYACGDKFLVVGRGVRYAKGPAAHPGAILIYMNPASNFPVAAKNIKLEAGLKQAGHKVQTVGDEAGLESALKSAKYDLVLADIADSPGLEKQVASQPSKPVVVPVLYMPSKQELSAAKKQYGCALNAPSKNYLATIDEAMSEKLKGTGAKTDKTK